MAKPESPNRITAITVENFKSLAGKHRAEIRPLTLLAGANSSGKSSLMQPLLLLKQTLEAPGDPGALLLDGDHVRFTRVDQVISAGSGGAFQTGIELHTGKSISLTFAKHKGVGFDVAACSQFDGRKHHTLRPGMQDAEIQSAYAVPNHMIDTLRVNECRFSVYRSRCFLKVRVESRDPNAKPGLSYFDPTKEDFDPPIRRVMHLAGLRGVPERAYPQRAVKSTFEGRFEQYAASVLGSWQAENSAALRRAEHAMRNLGLAASIDAKPISDVQIEVRVARIPPTAKAKAADMVNIADVGFGVSQALPVVVALVAAEPGQLVYIEEPEAHLHPRAQRRLAELLIEAANRGVVVVAETHSAILLREIQTQIAKGAIAPKDVVFHWFERNKDGFSTIKSVEPDENGAYGDWPVDFDDVDLDAEKAYLDAVEMRGLKA